MAIRSYQRLATSFKLRTSRSFRTRLRTSAIHKSIEMTSALLEPRHGPIVIRSLAPTLGMHHCCRLLRSRPSSLSVQSRTPMSKTIFTPDGGRARTPTARPWLAALSRVISKGTVKGLGRCASAKRSTARGWAESRPTTDAAWASRSHRKENSAIHCEFLISSLFVCNNSSAGTNPCAESNWLIKSVNGTMPRAALQVHCKVAVSH